MYIFWILLAMLIPCLIRVILGPSIWDRLLGLNLIASKISVLVAISASIFDLAYLLDVAIVSALLGFIEVIFLSLFLADRIREGAE